jgi:hypothetical protein
VRAGGARGAAAARLALPLLGVQALVLRLKLGREQRGAAAVEDLAQVGKRILGQLGQQACEVFAF